MYIGEELSSASFVNIGRLTKEEGYALISNVPDALVASSGQAVGCEGSQAMINKFLEEMRFFSPSISLAGKLFAAVEAARAEAIRGAMEDEEQIEREEEDELNITAPAAVATFGQVSAEEATVLQQRLLAEELYYHLAFLAGSQQAKSGVPLPIRESVVSGMANVLGLPEQEVPLAELADEFTGWVTELGQVTTGWGNIILAERGRIYLVERLPHGVGAEVPGKRVLIPYRRKKMAVALSSAGG